MGDFDDEIGYLMVEELGKITRELKRMNDLKEEELEILKKKR